MTINTEPRATKPRAISIDEDAMEEVLLPKVVEEDIRLVEEQLPARGTRNELPEGRILQLKFLDQVSGPVQTGNVLRGINDECLKLALVDSGEQIVNCGPAEAEIVLLDDGNGTITHETFKRRIIKTGEKKKPHFAKRVCKPQRRWRRFGRCHWTRAGRRTATAGSGQPSCRVRDEDCLHQVENGLICNDDMTFDRAFCVDEMQYFETDTLDLSDDIQGAIYLCLYSY